MNPPVHPEDRATWRHAALFAMACVSTTMAGVAFAGGDPFALQDWYDAEKVLGGFSYSAAALGILGAHEMGHFLQCRRRGVRASAPYFLPGLPIPGVGLMPFIGTFGAFIRMRPHPMTARDLLQIGAWGPIAGFVVALPVLTAGVAMSDVRPLPEQGDVLTLGDNLLMKALIAMFHGPIPAGSDLWLHPLAMAGWMGCFLTALNLMPVGQLDGGHIGYAIFGQTHQRVAPVVFAGMLLLGALVFPGWLVISGLVWSMGVRHPDTLCDAPGPAAGTLTAAVCAAIFILTFTPAPIVGMGLPQMLGWW